MQKDHSRLWAQKKFHEHGKALLLQSYGPQSRDQCECKQHRGTGLLDCCQEESRAFDSPWTKLRLSETRPAPGCTGPAGPPEYWAQVDHWMHWEIQKKHGAVESYGKVLFNIFKIKLEYFFPLSFQNIENESLKKSITLSLSCENEVEMREEVTWGRDPDLLWPG